MNKRLLDPALLPILAKIEAGERLSGEEGLALYTSRDLNGLGYLANIVRKRKNGNVATYVFNRYVNYSNICILNCQFCAFSAKKRDVHAFEMAIPEVAAKTREAWEGGATEIHMVGGLHPTLPASWYLDLLKAMKKAAPGIHIKAFTAIEIRHLADRIFKKPLKETLEILREAGLNALTGGGAEIFDQGVRDTICRGKETGEEWLEVHRAWHQMGQKSTATMLYGHVETAAQRIDHLLKLRGLQDETHGFTGFIPFAFVPETTELAHIRPACSSDELKNLAISRLMLDNFDHITGYWISLGLPLASIALNYGVDDLHGTIQEEKIFHMAGAKTPQQQTIASMEKAIREAGREPMQRNTFYERIVSTGSRKQVSEAVPA
ncbi:MAG: aminofutalosine synthase MqnE [Verrucomicrobia bacterium]|nr:MAG: aminofutalosine synthase MqnE [Verrucomicrobiota bacterium]